MKILKIGVIVTLLGCSSSNSDNLMTVVNYSGPLVVGIAATKAFGAGK